MEKIKKMPFKGFTITWLQDNEENHKEPPTLYPKATPEILKELGLEDGVPGSISTFLLEKDGKRALFDTGFGEFKYKPGHTLERLNSLNIKPEEINYIFITHLHIDHISGYLKDGNVVYPNAKVYISKQEHDGWMAMDNSKNELQRNVIEKMKPNLNLFQFNEKLPLDVIGLDASGHTPGHTVYQIDNVLILGDLIHGLALQLVHPEICATYDSDEAKSIEARKRILQLAKDNKYVFGGMHLPPPGFYSKYSE